MERNLSKKWQKIVTAFSSLDKNTKKFMKIGLKVFILLFGAGTMLLGISHYVLNFNSYITFIANSIIKSSFTILAEIIIGCLILDFLFNKY